jgi:hypothetical protein
MTEALTPLLGHDAGVRAGGGSAPGAANRLALAAAPTFALMAAWTALSSAPPHMLCMQPASPLAGMTAMYVLMSAFHAGPWLRWLAARS